MSMLMGIKKNLYLNVSCFPRQLKIHKYTHTHGYLVLSFIIFISFPPD